MISLPRENKEHPEGITQKNVCEGSTEPFLLKRSAPIGFVYPPPSEQFSANPYVTQTTYNPSYKPTLYDAAGRSATDSSANEENKVEEKNTTTEAKDTRIDACVTYCIISVVILVIVGVIIAIVYFLIQHPKLARALNEAINSHDTDDNNERTSLKKITAVANEFAKVANESSNVTFESSKLRDGDWNS